MSLRETICRLNLIVNKLRKRPSTFKEINEMLERESELQDLKLAVSDRTFQRNLEDILSLYNIEIRYDHSAKVYRITEDDLDHANDRMLEAFDVLNAFSLSDSLAHFVHFENRKPMGTEHLYGLLHATRNRLLVSIQYQKYSDTEQRQRKVKPFALKESRHRWYLIAQDVEDDEIKTFALDRIEKLTVHSRKFARDTSFDVHRYFEHCFGIIRHVEDVEQEIVLRFDPVQGKYIKSLPLHSSQEVLVDEADEFQIRLKIYITHDFIMELQSLGDTVEVIKPKPLAKRLKKAAQSVVKVYS